MTIFKKTLSVTIVGLLLLTGLSSWIIWQKLSEPSADSGALRTIKIERAEITAEIADDIIEQIQGLSGRPAMPENRGMLFVFPVPQSPGFWMKDMRFPIDIIWIAENGTVIGIDKNLSPDTYPKNFFPPAPVKYVLEVNAGWADSNGIKAGDKLSY